MLSMDAKSFADEDFFIRVALVAFAVLIVISTILYLWPRLITSALSGTREGFQVAAENDMPECLARNGEAQALYRMLYNQQSKMPPASDGAMAMDEFVMILRKLMCIESDIKSRGTGQKYSTFLLPFNTQHDMEPVGSFVGRCLKQAVRQRDIDITIDKLKKRGDQLLDAMCASEGSRSTAQAMFSRITRQVAHTLSVVCLDKPAPMDIPPGVRDPGYFTAAKYQSIGTVNDNGI
jgi:hypothetical protein